MASANWHIGFNEAQTEGTYEMFFLPKDAKFQGCDAEGFAIYAKDKPEVVTKKAFKLDPAKLAKARADRETVAATLGA